nr:hypothetical protein [Frondihabitans sp. PAMC 28766]
MRQGVTLGTQQDGGKCPSLANNVSLGAYAQVLGGIRLGDNVVVGAMSVVLKDVPSGQTVVGIPARPIS